MKKPNNEVGALCIGVMALMLRDDFGIPEHKAVKALRWAYRNVKAKKNLGALIVKQPTR